jgi:hypothetical protein
MAATTTTAAPATQPPATAAPASTPAVAPAALTAPAAPQLMQLFDKAMDKLLTNSEEIVYNAVGLLFKVLSNIVLHPMEEKYRKIKTTNAAFSSKVHSIPGGADCMRAAGFVEANGEWALHPSAQGWDLLVACKNKLELFFGKLSKQRGVASAGPTPAAAAPSASASPVTDPNAALLALMAALQSSSATGGDNQGTGP